MVALRGCVAEEKAATGGEPQTSESMPSAVFVILRLSSSESLFFAMSCWTKARRSARSSLANSACMQASSATTEVEVILLRFHEGAHIIQHGYVEEELGGSAQRRRIDAEGGNGEGGTHQRHCHEGERSSKS